ncbi:hypothetical protein JFU48_29170 [Pseudomonas sp. TH49]|uniref:hypothetical protein n=1 Tax=Pseudomonas sp. TH49 TaxID=2796413 RepID=UPI001914C258|nr:hypothetical protein [Pseudomonas sp. TH49]MBK5345411.1 hypothetical protein [Pseudomonas sp. TH49]
MTTTISFVEPVPENSTDAEILERIKEREKCEILNFARVSKTRVEYDIEIQGDDVSVGKNSASQEIFINYKFDSEGFKKHFKDK